jgi:hypothetical protein
MYQVHFTNSSKYLKFGTADGHGVGPGDSWQSGDLGDTWISSGQFGALAFHDLGDQHVPGDTQEKWGVLITYQGHEFIGRYEGGGRLEVSMNDYGQATITGMHIHQVLLPPVILQEHADAPK